MLVTFSCDAHEDITMFGDVAERLLKMMGHSGTVPSALLANDVPEALAQLQQALAQEKKNTGREVTKSSEDDEDEVSLSTRALPLIELLQDAENNRCNVMWSSR